MLKRAKSLKNLKKTGEKNSIFFLFSRFYTGRKNFINKKDLFYANFFEFEEFFIIPFFCSSIQPQHTVGWGGVRVKIGNHRIGALAEIGQNWIWGDGEVKKLKKRP